MKVLETSQMATVKANGWCAYLFPLNPAGELACQALAGAIANAA